MYGFYILDGKTSIGLIDGHITFLCLAQLILCVHYTNSFSTKFLVVVLLCIIVYFAYLICYSSANAYMLVYRMINSEKNTGMSIVCYYYMIYILLFYLLYQCLNIFNLLMICVALKVLKG